RASRCTRTAPGRSASPASAACWPPRTAARHPRCPQPARAQASRVVRSAGVTAGQVPAARHGGRSLALAVLCTVLFLTFLDNTIVAVALGSVQAELHAGVTALQWVVSAYALTFAGAMLAFGMVGDEFGGKKVMLVGVAIFCAGSVLSALAPNIELVIAGRAVMGLGAAASEPGTLSMLRHLYTDERTRTRALGVWTAVSGLALAAGPVVGGALVGVYSWRAIFWFNLFFGAAAAAAFFWWESRTAYPLLDLKYLRVPTFLTANIVAFCAYFATFAVFSCTALYLVEVVGYTGYQIALAFLPMTALMIISSLLAGRWAAMAGPRWSIFAGLLLFGAGLLLTTLTLSPHPAYTPLAAALGLTGIGIGATVVPIPSAALSAVPPERSGM